MSNNSKTKCSICVFLWLALGIIMLVCTALFVMYKSNAQEYEFHYKYEQMIGKTKVIENVDRCVDFNSNKTDIEKIKVKFLETQTVKDGELTIKKNCEKSSNTFGAPKSERLRYYEVF